MFVRRRIVLLLFVGLCLLMGLLAARPTSGAAPEGRYVVKPGDTLWAIAVARYDGDPREGVWRLKERNGLEDSFLQPGDVLHVPP